MAKATRKRAAERDWFRISARGERAAELSIFGDIGENWWEEESNTARAVVDRIAALGDISELVVRINSYGGSVNDGVAIYNALKRHPANVTVTVEGVAVSIASLMAMAGDTVIMPANTLMMIHAPWSVALGNAKEFRDKADLLDKFAEAMSTSYAAKTGKSDSEILDLLSDGEDHWFTAAEAVEFGLADYMTEPLEAAASLRMDRFSIPAATAASLQEDMPMAGTKKPEAPKADSTTPDPQGATPENHDINVADLEKAASARMKAEIKERNDAIRARYAKHLPKEGVGDLYADVISDVSLTVEDAMAKLLDHLGSSAEPAHPAGSAPDVQGLVDERDKRVAGVSAALLVRAGVASPEVRASVDASNPWRGARLLDIARDSLDRAGMTTRGMTPMEIVGAAFTQSTSDFPVLLENTMHKALQSAYALAPDTWSRFCAIGSVSDFRDHNRYRTGSLGNLDVTNELGEFQNKPIPDGEKAKIAVTTRGNIVNMSRQMVVNDDLGAFVGLAAMQGRAARRTIEATVYSVLAENGGLGPTLLDGLPLFDAGHGNVGSGAVNSVAHWDALRILMATQMDVSNNDYLDLRPAVWLGPIGLGGLARQINEAQYDDEATKRQNRPNISRGLVRDIVDTPRLSGTRYYMFADPAEAPVLEVAFLDGVQTPYLERQDGFDVDGSRFKVRLDFGVGGVDFRGALTDAGQ